MSEALISLKEETPLSVTADTPRFARLNGALVVEVVAFPGGIPVGHPDLVWQAITPGASVAPGWMHDATGFHAPLPPPLPTLAQQAALMLAAGCRIVSTGSPALNGTYPCDDKAQNRLGLIQARINAGLGFPGGASTLGWLDVTGATHNFTAAQFTVFAAAISDYAYPLEMTALGIAGHATPPQPSTIP